MKTIIRFVALFAVLALVACTKSYLHADVAQAEGVVVQPLETWIGGHKLWVRVDVVNEGQEAITVNRDAIVARLPSGQVVGRAVGRWTQHEAYVVPPQATHPVYVEFEEAGFDWDRTPSVTIDFGHALMRGNQPIVVQMAISM